MVLVVVVERVVPVLTGFVDDTAGAIEDGGEAGGAPLGVAGAADVLAGAGIGGLAAGASADAVKVTRIENVSGKLLLQWSGGVPPYQVEFSPTAAAATP